MRHALPWALSLALVACGKAPAPAEPTTAPHADEVTRLASLAGARCGVCHDLGPVAAQLPPAPSLDLLWVARRGAALRQDAPQLACPNAPAEGHADLLAWLASLAVQAPAPAAVAVDAATIGLGERLVAELGCGACHDPRRLDALSDATDHAQLTAFLIDPMQRSPGLAHVPLPSDEARAIAAYLLRGQSVDGHLAPGFAYECFELEIGDDEPDLARREAAATGFAERVHADLGTRKNNYALRFTARLDVPTAGEWTFAVGSDDGSWLYVDEQLVVANGGRKPHKVERGTVRLTAGAHALRVVYTQAGGGKSLEVKWRGPGLDEQELGPANAQAAIQQLVPKFAAVATPDAAAVARGRAAARAARCDACHGFDDAEFAALPAPIAAPAWVQLAGDKPCPNSRAGTLRQSLGAMPAAALDASTELAVMLRADGCLRCHVRDGEGGLPPAVRKQLVEVEDLGEEGIIAPDLSAVGRRLRPQWLAETIAEGRAVRDYVKLRMPRYGKDRGARYAELFAAVDAPGLVDEEPPFSADLVEQGRRAVGIGARNCITCHRVLGHASLGPQGMDLELQARRLRPGWFRDWLLRPHELRPGTRMPALWLPDDPAARGEVDAIRTWCSLGNSAPLPNGIALDPSSYVLEPIGRPVLHAAFLDGVSPRALMVGSPERTHYAWDLDRARLAWIWRGGFVDGRGTWHARAGKLIRPLGNDWRVLDDFAIDGAEERRVVGQRRAADGYPVLQVAAGAARYDDVVRPRLGPGGSVLVRTITCTAGAMTLQFAAPPDGVTVQVGEAAAARHQLTAGQSLEVVYQW
ncbi:MAG: PA14 domain-containing protein [Planctomycetota bacterium]